MALAIVPIFLAGCGASDGDGDGIQSATKGLYRCQDCGEEFEELVRSPDEPVECEACDSGNVTRKMSTFATKVSGRTVADLSRADVAAAGSKCTGCSGGDCSSC